MQIFGVMMVRDEVDILRVNILHHLALGIDQFLIVDNGSSDGTDLLLEELSRDGRVQWTRDPGPYYQSEITTELAHEAFLRGGAIGLFRSMRMSFGTRRGVTSGVCSKKHRLGCFLQRL